FRRRGTHRVAETAILARCLPAVTGRTQRLPPGPVPEHRFIAAVRINVVDDRCRTDHVMTTALAAERMRAQECGAFGAPALRAVERAGFWIASPCIVLVALTLLAPPNGTVDRWTNGHDADLNDGNDGAGNEKRLRGLLPSRRATLASIARIYPIRAVSVLLRYVRRTFFAELRQLCRRPSIARIDYFTRTALLCSRRRDRSSDLTWSH